MGGMVSLYDPRAMTGKIFRGLSLFFSYPGEEVREMLGSSSMGDTGMQGLLSLYAGTGPSSLRDEYLRLFRPGGVLSPYESSYVGAASASAVLADVSGFYMAWGLRPSRARPDMPDSIVTELEFAAFILHVGAAAEARRKKNAAMEARRTFRMFVVDHIAAWIPRLCTDVKKKARLEFYRRLASATQRTIAAVQKTYD